MPGGETHGLLQSNPQQTYCGLNPNTTTIKATRDPMRVTCSDCVRFMTITNDMPNLGGPVHQRKRGRPRKEKNGKV